MKVSSLKRVPMFYYVIQTMIPEDVKPGTDPGKIREIPYWYAGITPIPPQYGVKAVAPLWSPYLSDIEFFRSMALAKFEADRLAKEGLHRFSIIVASKSKISEAWPDPLS